MKKDEFAFLELFGNIDERYIDAAMQPWEKEPGGNFRCLGRKAACVILIAALGCGFLYHEPISAAISRFTTQIAEILQIGEDLTPYTERIGTTQEKNGISVTLNEVMLSGNSLFLSVTVDSGQENESIGVGADGAIWINGKEYACSSAIYLKQTLDEDSGQYVMQWSRGDGMPIEEGADIKLSVLCYKDMEDDKGEEFPFVFSAHNKELQEHMVHIEPKQEVDLDGHTAVITDFTINTLTSSLVMECDGLWRGGIWYCALTDTAGNQFLYPLTAKEGAHMLFQKNGDIPSYENTWLDGQLYYLPCDADSSESVEADALEVVEISEVVTVDFANMRPVGEAFRIVLKES